jgi:hypothetical protein
MPFVSDALSLRERREGSIRCAMHAVAGPGPRFADPGPRFATAHAAGHAVRYGEWGEGGVRVRGSRAGAGLQHRLHRARTFESA